MMTSMYNQLKAAVFQDEEGAKKYTLGGIGLNFYEINSEVFPSMKIPPSISQELVEIGSGGLKSEYQTLKEQVAVAQVEAGAARDDDAVLIDKMHVQGPAFHSRALAVGDRILAVNDTMIGTDLLLAGRLIRGQVGTEVRIKFRSASNGSEGEVVLERALIPDHAAQYEEDENGEPPRPE